MSRTQPIACVFDLDGTLVDSIPGIDACARAALAEEAPDLALPSLRTFIGPPIRAMLARALNLADEARLDGLEAAFRRHYDNGGWRDTPVYPGVVETLHWLHASGAHLYVLTNKPALPTRRILEHLGLSRLFVEIVSPDSRTPRHASKSAAALDLRMRIPPGAKTILVGDSDDDAHAAAAAGFAFAAAAWGYGRIHLSSPPPAYSLANVAEIRTLVPLFTV